MRYEQVLLDALDQLYLLRTLPLLRLFRALATSAFLRAWAGTPCRSRPLTQPINLTLPTRLPSRFTPRTQTLLPVRTLPTAGQTHNISLLVLKPPTSTSRFKTSLPSSTRSTRLQSRLPVPYPTRQPTLLLLPTRSRDRLPQFLKFLRGFTR